MFTCVNFKIIDAHFMTIAEHILENRRFDG